MSSKIARALGTVVIAAAPFIMLTAPAASATGGCVVNNASTSTTISLEITYPPLEIAFGSTSLSCSYISGGGTVNWGCTLAGGRCEMYKSSATGTVGACVTAANGSCTGHFEVAAGETVTLNVYGGSGYVADAV